MTDPDAPRTVEQALARARAEAQTPTEDWDGMCLRFVRTCYGIPPLFASAWAAWLGCDADAKHTGGHPDDAPVGALLFYKGAGPYGHVMIAANPLNSGPEGAWSNDLVEPGKIDHVSRVAPIRSWGQAYLGWTNEVNGYDVILGKPRRPKPYPRIQQAIDDLLVARKTARRIGERSDVAALTAEIEHLRDLRDLLRKGDGK